MKLFISQPMAGKTDKEILDERERVLCNVKELFPDKEIEVIDSFFQNAPADARPLWFLGKSLELLSTADIISARIGKSIEDAVSNMNVVLDTQLNM